MRSVICKILIFFVGILNSVGIPLYPAEKDVCNMVSSNSFNIIQNGKEYDYYFDECEINTAEIAFKDENENTVEIYSGNKLIYRRTGTEVYRFCAFETVKTGSLKIRFEKEAAVKDIKLSCRKSNNKDFRITAYAVANSVNGEIDPAYFDVVTDVILIGAVTFNEKGELNADKAVLENALSRLRSAIGDRDVKIYMNVLGPGSAGGETWDDQMHSLADRHTAAFKNNGLVTAMVGLCDEYGFDGIFFDYEYPLRSSDYRQFGKFLKKLDKATDKKLGAAISAWNIPSICEEVRNLDMLELMMYDSFDSAGHHSSFTTAVDGFTAIRNDFIDTERVDLGVPFYGRPADRGGYWPSYRQYADVLNGIDSADTEQGKAYFNCVQTIYDKTAYALSRGLGGMMVWHFTCDADMNSPASLFAAMGRCVRDRTE
ncbi:MAG: glycoside hydrolase family 18 protein [Clostridia bacterium]|nr:glycoside hydrolase family 18 protein [Clostridia bacterium]